MSATTPNIPNSADDAVPLCSVPARRASLPKFVPTLGRWLVLAALVLILDQISKVWTLDSFRHM